MGENATEDVMKFNTPEAPIEVTPRIQKSRRRSSFVTGRKSNKRLSLSASVYGTDLCKHIPEDLPENERLEKLHCICLEHSFEQLSTEFCDVPNLKKSYPEVREAFSTTLSKLKENNFFKNVVTPLPSAPSNLKPEEISEKDKSILTAIEEYKNYTAELEKESKQWDTLCDQYEVWKEKVSPEIEVDDSQYQYLPQERKEALRNLTDYEAEVKKLRETSHKIRHYVSHYQNVEKVLGSAISVANQVYKRECQGLYNQYLGKQDNSQQLIENILKGDSF